MKDDRLYLAHILDCLQRIDEYALGGRDAFDASTLIQDAVLRNLQTLAESTQRISQTLRDAHPEVPWRELSGFRNVVVHDYLGIDMDLIWSIVELKLPLLRQSAEQMLAETLRSAFPPAEHLGDAAGIQAIVDWLRDLVLAGVIGGVAYDLVKGAAVDLLRSLRRRRGSSELQRLEQQVFEELKRVKRQPKVSNEDLRRRTRALFESIDE